MTTPVSPTVYSMPDAAATFVVPAGKTSIIVEMWAGGGGNQGTPTIYSGGGSGYLKCTIPVTPGETLDLIIGDGGLDGGFNSAIGGGGQGGQLAAGGGGRSEIKRSATILATVGGGGGGAYSTTGSSGGAGGGTNGVSSGGSFGGGAGTQSSGGASGGLGGTAGTAGTGGNGGSDIPDGTFGGGGGGGYYGGGGGGAQGTLGGSAGGGGGGSGYYDPVLTSSQTLTAGSGSSPAGTGSPYYASPAGVGATGGILRGGPGRIVIY